MATAVPLFFSIAGQLPIAARLERIPGSTGANVIGRIMGIILAAIAVDAVHGGLDALNPGSFANEGSPAPRTVANNSGRKSQRSQAQPIMRAT
ncbi:MAG: MarC family protein [Pseudomonadota bacterium]